MSVLYSGYISVTHGYIAAAFGEAVLGFVGAPLRFLPKPRGGFPGRLSFLYQDIIELLK